ncbi:MAG: hypothetical protein EOM03_19375 [Clostridia bacterium]|nr:hypothetical protein [Clostridia bacterium]
MSFEGNSRSMGNFAQDAPRRLADLRQGDSMANNTVKKLLGIVVVAIMVLTGCSSSQKSWEAVATNAGFEDVRVVSGNNEVGYVMYASAGVCQVRLVTHPGEHRLYATVPGSQSVEDSEFIGDPAVAQLQEDPRFEHCFVLEAEEGEPAP